LPINAMQLFAGPRPCVVSGVALHTVTINIFRLTKTRGTQNAPVRLKKERRKIEAPDRARFCFWHLTLLADAPAGCVTMK